MLAQTEFSADIFDTQKQGTPSKSRIYDAKDKISFDSKEHDSKGGAFIMNLATQTMTILMPEQRMYMDMLAAAGKQRKMFSLLQASVAKKASGDWQKLATNKGGPCHK